ETTPQIAFAVIGEFLTHESVNVRLVSCPIGTCRLTHCASAFLRDSTHALNSSENSRLATHCLQVTPSRNAAIRSGSTLRPQRDNRQPASYGNLCSACIRLLIVRYLSSFPRTYAATTLTSDLCIRGRA